MSDTALAADWPAPHGVRTLVTVRGMPGASSAPFEAFNLGDRCGDDPVAVAANRAALAALLPAPPRWLRQEHGTDVYVAEPRAVPAHPSPADASYTDATGVVLAVLTADCLPLLVCSVDGAEIAAIHAGWRGLAAGAIEAALARFRAPRERLLAWLGPAIGAASYEVGVEVRDALVTRDPSTEIAFTPTRPGHWHCDLSALARRRLAAGGVGAVFGGGFDTFVDSRFYSHRRDSVTGRFASLIWREA